MHCTIASLLQVHYPCMQALNILRQCHSYEKRPVEAGVILFNIKTCTIRTGFLGLLQREGIQGTSVYGTKCTFLTGTRVLFSSRQCDTKCTLRECAEVIEYPQEVTVFLKKGVSREFPQLKNLGTLTLTGKEEKRYLVVSKAGGSKYDKLHTLPLDSSMKVTNATDDCHSKGVNQAIHPSVWMLIYCAMHSSSMYIIRQQYVILIIAASKNKCF